MRSLIQSFILLPSDFKRMQKIKFCFPSTQGFHPAETWYYLMWSHVNPMILVEDLFLCLIICYICTVLNGSLYDITQTHLYGEDKSWHHWVYFHLFKELFLFPRIFFFQPKYHILFWMIARRLILALKEESWISLARIMPIACTHYTYDKFF